jgi:hypothetical protein
MLSTTARTISTQFRAINYIITLNGNKEDNSDYKAKSLGRELSLPITSNLFFTQISTLFSVGEYGIFD